MAHPEYHQGDAIRRSKLFGSMKEALSLRTLPMYTKGIFAIDCVDDSIPYLVFSIVAPDVWG